MAVPSSQHSPMLGQLASSHTVWSEPDRIIFLKDGHVVDETILSGDGRAGADNAQEQVEAAR